MWRPSLLAFLLLAGCSKPVDFPDVVVPAASTDDLAAFRSDLNGRFPPERLQLLDTALDELKLDAMNRGVKTADAREQDMLAVINGQIVQKVLILGWTARRARLLREIAFMNGQVEYNLKAQAGRGKTLATSTHLQNLDAILGRLHGDLTDAEQRLAGWGAPATRP